MRTSVSAVGAGRANILRACVAAAAFLLVVAPVASAASATATPRLVEPGDRVLLEYHGDPLPVVGGLVAEGEVTCFVVAPDGSTTSPCDRSGSALTLRLAAGTPPEASVTIVAPSLSGVYRVVFDVASALPSLSQGRAAETTFSVLAPATGTDGATLDGAAFGDGSTASANSGAVAPAMPGLPISWPLAALILLAVLALLVALALAHRGRRSKPAHALAATSAGAPRAIAGPVVFGPVRASAPAAPLLMRGRETLEEGDAARALVLFDAATDLEPRSPLARLGRGLALERLGRDEEARAEIARAAATAPAEPSVFYHQARLLVAGGRAKDAVAKLRVALNLDPALAPTARGDRAFAALAQDDAFRRIVGTGAD
ncbi:MAG TPA: tetratricopeptide repeat protein [Candidatus Thermoplasmatota archaeon]|nr:tetratricopeptide repeat protein [Candidatus Thermoplasmatota archaeon]